MKECNFETLIDDYLLNKLSEEKKETFENHYFNCHSCFEKIEERDSLISVIKSKGHKIFQDRKETERTRRPFFERLFSSSFLTPKQWTMAAISACVLLIAVIGIVPNLNLKSPTPQFVMDSQTIRGSSLGLISPVTQTEAIPSEFKWENLGEGVDYKIYIYRDNLLWSASTTTPSISLPEDIKILLKPGEIYAWEVKAFSQEGSLITASKKVQFQIDSHR
ncbi:zf-HC2 domain-containing protein [Acidobacteriota bacterium]